MNYEISKYIIFAHLSKINRIMLDSVNKAHFFAREIWDINYAVIYTYNTDYCFLIFIINRIIPVLDSATKKNPEVILLGYAYGC